MFSLKVRTPPGTTPPKVKVTFPPNRDRLVCIVVEESDSGAEDPQFATCDVIPVT